MSAVQERSEVVSTWKPTRLTLNGLRQLIEYPLCALVSFGALRRDWTMLSAMRAGSRLCIQASDAPTPCCMPA